MHCCACACLHEPQCVCLWKFFPLLLVQCVVNLSGPNAMPPSSVDKLWAEMIEAGNERSHSVVTSNSVVGLWERLETVMKHTNTIGLHH